MPSCSDPEEWGVSKIEYWIDQSGGPDFTVHVDNEPISCIEGPARRSRPARRQWLKQTTLNAMTAIKSTQPALKRVAHPA
jgi:hypothetical protein